MHVLFILDILLGHF